MKFEHLVQINDPSLPGIDWLTRQQLWFGLVARAWKPTRFVLGLEDAQVIQTKQEGNVTTLARVLNYGPFQIEDTIDLIEEDRHQTFLVESSVSAEAMGADWMGGLVWQADDYASDAFPAFDYRYTAPAVFAQVERDQFAGRAGLVTGVHHEGVEPEAGVGGAQALQHQATAARAAVGHNGDEAQDARDKHLPQPLSLVDRRWGAGAGKAGLGADVAGHRRNLKTEEANVQRERRDLTWRGRTSGTRWGWGSRRPG